MKCIPALLLIGFAAAIPVDILELPTDLVARRANITERTPSLEDRQASISIHNLWKNKGKVYFGVATDRGLLQTGKNAAIIQANFGQVTPENSMKWQSLNPSQGTYNWGDADYLINFATSNGKSVRGHTLVWHSQLPSWVADIRDANTLRNVIRNHVTTVVTRYKGKIRAWVSEATMTRLDVVET